MRKRVTRPEPVVPRAHHKHVETEARNNEVREPHQHHQQRVHQNRGRWIPPSSRVLYPPHDVDHPRHHVYYPVPVRAHFPHAEVVRILVQHVKHHFLPQRRLRPFQVSRHHPHCCAPQRLLLHYPQRFYMVHQR
ncbi:hypothetical protein VIGAN_05271000 [Vigna angularis var. angularis]|uniref:Uncharacterized protein n=1 Tax=Vigna angularis var. angularis TaxID=157739 RepID=A0A0S3S8B8_PHAAN|nr:hypothetical protein VIGAN_05271000 [Vigna angularis var. angularis]